MSVFTTLNLEDVQYWLRDFDIGEIVALKGIAAGITNTNYFVNTHKNRYVLTIFEKNDLGDLPYFVDLMAHLSAHGVPCPTPIADKNGVALHLLKGKPALMVSCLNGQDVATPNLQQVKQVAKTLAQMHVAGLGFNKPSINQRGQQWFSDTVQKVLPHLTNATDAKLLTDEMAHLQSHNLVEMQNAGVSKINSALPRGALPYGVVHGDLFRDNVLFDGDQLGGFIDFYYACQDVLVYDVAIAVNEWCLHHNGSDLGTIDTIKVEAFLDAYQQIRPFTVEESQSWQAMLRRAALRFWLSRLHDFYFPEAGLLTHIKDPNHFKNILQQHIAAKNA